MVLSGGASDCVLDVEDGMGIFPSSLSYGIIM